MRQPDIFARLKRLLKLLTPPILIQVSRTLMQGFATQPEWQNYPEAWAAAQKDSHLKGWNVRSVLDAYKSRWPEFIAGLQGTHPLGGGTNSSLPSHNTVVSFAYALTLASRNKASLSMLDWGGGIGHYYLISRAILPDLEINYTCKDVPILCEHGRELFPEVTFCSDDSFLNHRYDFVLASGSLQYATNWVETLKQICKVTNAYLFVTRLPIIQHRASFIVAQRAYDSGFLHWILNRQEFLKCAADAGMQLIREFLVPERLDLYDPHKQCEYGFLFYPGGSDQKG